MKTDMIDAEINYAYFFHYLFGGNRTGWRTITKSLTYRESEVLAMRFSVIPRTHEEIGKYFSVSRERIRQVESNKENETSQSVGTRESYGMCV